jgi:hypothetical protein
VATEAVAAALGAEGAEVGVDLVQLNRARCLLDPYLRKELRAAPAPGGQVCEGCEFYTGEACCRGEAGL